MELDFDKEIDALLREARRHKSVMPQTARHLDADEISAFAENALPSNLRATYTAHFADCDRCRGILSNLAVLSSSEAAAAAASPAPVITIAEREIPWYRKLLLFPKLAYVMGTLVLMFGGFLVFTIIQNSQTGESSVALQPESEVTRGGPNIEAQRDSLEMPAANTNANVAEAADVASNSTANVAARPPMITSGSGPRDGENMNFSADAVGAAEAMSAPAAPAGAPVPAAKETSKLPVLTLGKDKAEEKVAAVEDVAGNEPVFKQQQAANMPSQSGPMRNNESQYNRRLEQSDLRATAAKKRDEGSAGSKVVSGKTFERKQGVWYDTTYQGAPTINVRRGTDEFKKLDKGLRKIANDLPGTIVVVWEVKAYRIQ